jgi:hypothetical protein
MPDALASLDTGTMTVINETRGTQFAVQAEVSPREKNILKAGGKLNMIRAAE